MISSWGKLHHPVTVSGNYEYYEDTRSVSLFRIVLVPLGQSQLMNNFFGFVLSLSGLQFARWLIGLYSILTLPSFKLMQKYCIGRYVFKSFGDRKCLVGCTVEIKTRWIAKRILHRENCQAVECIELNVIPILLARSHFPRYSLLLI